jgi:hypothetical protein
MTKAAKSIILGRLNGFRESFILPPYTGNIRPVPRTLSFNVLIFYITKQVRYGGPLMVEASTSARP